MDLSGLSAINPVWIYHVLANRLDRIGLDSITVD